ncbi:D-galacturonate reductase [Vitis vinifera]|uniref:NADP-dependent oxidoreductase domain-containing protein n=1 Tax=Vitis vinifera TaxID=29760 RepID=F6HF94_VITVI|nr:D-galacturonate reductase [Vitis vinifera]|eukprot:XP_002285230.1 PREDICTED: D-galacturonate reductase [Vitis vinifera]
MGVVPELPVGSCSRAMPVIGMGTSVDPPISAEAKKSAFLEGIKNGYRHFDTAFIYASEQPLGEAIAEALQLGLIKSRDELFITSKLGFDFAERHLVVPAIKMSLQNLQLEYLDLFLIHWPLRLSPGVWEFPTPKQHILPIDMKSVWEGMEECQNLSLTKAIGVSNFSPKKLEEILSFAKIPPAVNQVEMNPFWQQKDLREFCKAKGIQITAYSPLGGVGTQWGDDRVMGCDVLKDIAKAKGKTTAQVSLRWLYAQGVSMVAKSFNKDRMKENLEIFDWSLTNEELNKIDQLPQRKRVLLAPLLGPHDLVLEIDAEI